MGNGARAAYILSFQALAMPAEPQHTFSQKRERNAKDGKGEAKSQLAANAKSMDKICSVCRQA